MSIQMTPSPFMYGDLPDGGQLCPMVIATRAPTSNDKYPNGYFWLNSVSFTLYCQMGFSSGVPTWSPVGGGSADLSTLTASSGGAISPTAGNINLLGTANQITTVGAGSTITFSIPSTFIAPGSIASTTTLTGGTGITATTGNIVATAGNISATVGSVSAATTVTGGTGVIATTGNLTASAGSVVVTAPSVAGASPVVNNARSGQASFTDVIANGAYGTLTITNSTITAASIITATASCTTVNSAVQIVEVTPGSGTVGIRVFNAGAASTAANININYWVMN